MDSNSIYSHPHVIRNKYFNWYIKLTSNKMTGEFIDRHHILPRCMGGSDDPSNIAHLTIRAHFIAHILLLKFVTNTSQIKMAHACKMMLGNREGVKINSKLIASAIEINRKSMSARIVSDETKKKMSKAQTANTNSNHKWYVRTPLGIFNSLGEAARAHDTASSTVLSRCQSDTFEQWTCSETPYTTPIPKEEIIQDPIRRLWDKNKVTYQIISPTGEILHTIHGGFEKFCLSVGLCSKKARLAARTNVPLTYKNSSHPWHGVSIVKTLSRNMKYTTSNAKYIVILDQDGLVMHSIMGSLNSAAMYLNIPNPNMLSHTIKTGKQMYKGRFGMVYSCPNPKLYLATARYATKEEISTLTWVDTRIVTKR